jgi:hypothetical protein
MVEGKKLETSTEEREEGNMGNSAAVINLVTVEKSEKGKEKILEPENQVVSKWEYLVALLDEGVINMKLMRDMLEVFKGKMEILAQKWGMGCVEEGKGQLGVQQGTSGAKIHLGPDGVKENGPRYKKPTLYFSKTYYRKRYRAVALWRATRRLRCEQKELEMSPESSLEVIQSGAIGLLHVGDKNSDLESLEKNLLAREKATASGGGRSKEEGQASGRPNGAIQAMGQLHQSLMVSLKPYGWECGNVFEGGGIILSSMCSLRLEMILECCSGRMCGVGSHL